MYLQAVHRQYTCMHLNVPCIIDTKPDYHAKTINTHENTLSHSPYNHFRYGTGFTSVTGILYILSFSCMDDYNLNHGQLKTLSVTFSDACEINVFPLQSPMKHRNCLTGFPLSSPSCARMVFPLAATYRTINTVRIMFNNAPTSAYQRTHRSRKPDSRNLTRSNLLLYTSNLMRFNQTSVSFGVSPSCRFRLIVAVKLPVVGVGNAGGTGSLDT